MSRHENQRLDDVLTAAAAITSYLERSGLDDGMAFDAVRVRLIEIGEAVKSFPQEFLDQEPGIPWTEIARMRDRLAHRYFDTNHAIVEHTVRHDLPELEAAVQRLRRRSGSRS